MIQTLHDNDGYLPRLGGDQYYEWPSGDTYSGHIEDGMKSGWGILTSKQNNIVSLAGHWKEGRLEGKGRMVRYKGQ